MRLYHKVIRENPEEIATKIMIEGLRPQVASSYKDLVPLGIRDKPVVWLTENLKLFEDEPCFVVDAEKLDKNKLYRTEVVFEADKKLKWWIYQGFIVPDLIFRAGI